LTILVGFLIIIHLWQLSDISLDSFLGGSRFIEQDRDLQWKHSHSGIYHSYVTLPLDHRDPSAGHVRIALAQIPARNKNPLGSLIIGMGHPGESGTKSLYEVGEEIMDIVEGSYNLIGFDARGVNLTSNHFSCFNDDITKHRFYSDSKDESSLQGRVCSEPGRGGEYISTALTATDLLRISRILGDDKLNYIGFSYGSIIGNTFAQISPKHVGRMALDGIIDPEMYYNTGETLKHVKCIFPECKEVEDTPLRTENSNL
jgi:pimeloyl-ACP methyl ester carboxylesterase